MLTTFVDEHLPNWGKPISLVNLYTTKVCIFLSTTKHFPQIVFRNTSGLMLYLNPKISNEENAVTVTVFSCFATRRLLFWGWQRCFDCCRTTTALFITTHLAFIFSLYASQLFRRHFCSRSPIFLLLRLKDVAVRNFPMFCCLFYQCEHHWQVFLSAANLFHMPHAPSTCPTSYRVCFLKLFLHLATPQFLLLCPSTYFWLCFLLFFFRRIFIMAILFNWQIGSDLDFIKVGGAAAPSTS